MISLFWKSSSDIMSGFSQFSHKGRLADDIILHSSRLKQGRGHHVKTENDLVEGQKVLRGKVLGISRCWSHKGHNTSLKPVTTTWAISTQWDDSLPPLRYKNWKLYKRSVPEIYTFWLIKDVNLNRCNLKKKIYKNVQVHCCPKSKTKLAATYKQTTNTIKPQLLHYTWKPSV